MTASIDQHEMSLSASGHASGSGVAASQQRPAISHPVMADPVEQMDGITPAAMRSDVNAQMALKEYIDRARIHIVDDEPCSVKAIQKCLKDAGFNHLKSTIDSRMAIEEARNFRPHLILLDIRMPEVDGLQVLEQVRRDVDLADTCVVMMTACSEDEMIDRAFELGCSDYFQKPLSAKLTALRVRNVLTSRSMQYRLEKQLAKLESQVDLQALTLENAKHDAERKYLVGKAEIATDVLHNVGNALNSVNVGATLIKNAIKESRLPSLKRASSLLRDNLDHLAKYLTRDERGKLLPSYLIELADVLIAERSEILNELDLLSKHIEHINSVVATQQKYAKVCLVSEDVRLDELVKDVEELLREPIQNVGIQVTHHFEEVPEVHSDRQKLLQVVLNLVKNAIDAIRQNQRSGHGRLDICIVRRNAGHALLTISDNGVGIPKANLKKIFSHGFTTKDEGHGFGLHSCANIIKELGGSIHVSSEGWGQGATFAIELPFQLKE